MDYEKLMKIAYLSRNNAYAPYSNYKVGSALLTKSGKIYTGANVENLSFSLTDCAERVALTKAVSEGEREFLAIALVGGKGEDIDSVCMPCGACRQAFAEFCSGDFMFIVGTPDKYFIYTLNDLMPMAFAGEIIGE